MSLSLAELMASTAAMRDIFSASGNVAAMLEVEAGFARANAALGLIPAVAAEAISKKCDAGGLDSAQLGQDGALAGTVVIPLVAWLKAQLPDVAKHVHRGATSQDVIDTALVLQLRRGVLALDAELAMTVDAAAGLARDYALTPMLARTLMQPALASTFGLKAAYWLAMLDDAGVAIQHASREALVLQCGGAAGTQDGFGADAGRFVAALSAELDLPAAVLPWHTRRGPLVRLGCAIAAAMGVLGKIAGDIILMMQAELGEASEPAAPGRGGSSAMAHKRNPTLCIQAKAAAMRAPHLAAGLLAAMAQEHERAAGAWQAEQTIWPELMLAASGAFAAMREILQGLEVNPASMARNLDAITSPDGSAAIPDMIAAALAQHGGI